MPYPRQNQPSGQLGHLLQLAQIQSMLQGGDNSAERESQAQMNLAVHLLGLQRQTQSDAAQNALAQSGQESLDRYRTAEVAHMGQQEEHQRNSENLAQQVAQAAALAESQKVEATNHQHDQATRAALIQHYMSQPNANINEVRQLMGDFSPEMKSGFDAIHQGAVQAQVPQMQQSLGAIYKANAGDPTKLKAALDMMKLSQPEAFNAVDWNGLNQSIVPHPTQTTTASVGGGFGSLLRHLPSAVASGLQHGEDWMQNQSADFLGNLLGIHPSAESDAYYAARRNAWLQNNPPIVATQP